MVKKLPHFNWLLGLIPLLDFFPTQLAKGLFLHFTKVTFVVYYKHLRIQLFPYGGEIDERK